MAYQTQPATFRRIRSLAVFLFLGVTACESGCAPVLTPPAQAEVGGVYHPTQWKTDRSSRLPAYFRVGVHPRQLEESALGRNLDVGAGYAYEGPTVLHGTYAELDWTPIHVPFEDGEVRSGVGVQTRLAYQPDLHAAAQTLALRARLFEWVSFSNDGPYAPGRGRPFLGVAYGEGGIGLVGEVSAVRLDGRVYGSLSLGLTGRIPAAAGLVFPNIIQ